MAALPATNIYKIIITAKIKIAMLSLDRFLETQIMGGKSIANIII